MARGRSARSSTSIWPTRQWPPEAAAAARASTAACRRWTEMFQGECAELKTAGEDKQTLRRIAAVLAVPLLSGRERNWLRDDRNGREYWPRP